MDNKTIETRFEINRVISFALFKVDEAVDDTGPVNKATLKMEGDVVIRLFNGETVKIPNQTALLSITYNEKTQWEYILWEIGVFRPVAQNQALINQLSKVDGLANQKPTVLFVLPPSI